MIWGKKSGNLHYTAQGKDRAYQEGKGKRPAYGLGALEESLQLLLKVSLGFLASGRQGQSHSSPFVQGFGGGESQAWTHRDLGVVLQLLCGRH